MYESLQTSSVKGIIPGMVTKGHKPNVGTWGFCGKVGGEHNAFGILVFSRIFPTGLAYVPAEAGFVYEERPPRNFSWSRVK